MSKEFAISSKILNNVRDDASIWKNLSCYVFNLTDSESLSEQKFIQKFQPLLLSVQWQKIMVSMQHMQCQHN